MPDRGEEGLDGQVDRLAVERALVVFGSTVERGLVDLSVVVGTDTFTSALSCWRASSASLVKHLRRT